MNIALDFDDTITLDVSLWSTFVTIFRNAGHKIYIVSLRPDSSFNEDIEQFVAESPVDGVLYTSGLQKDPYCLSKGITIDIFIDDSPEMIPSAYRLKKMVKGCKNFASMGEPLRPTSRDRKDFLV